MCKRWDTLFIFSPGYTRLRRDQKQRRAREGALAGTPHSPMPPRAHSRMVTLSLLAFLSAPQAPETRGPLCLHPRASMPIASVHHQWIAYTLVWSRESKGWGWGLPHARPCRCQQRHGRVPPAAGSADNGTPRLEGWKARGRATPTVSVPRLSRLLGEHKGLAWERSLSGGNDTDICLI